MRPESYCAGLAALNPDETLDNCLLCMAEYLADRPTFLVHSSQWRVVVRPWNA